MNERDLELPSDNVTRQTKPIFLALFGPGGSGKSYVAGILANEFGFYHYEGDNDIPEEMLGYINRNQTVPEHIRDDYYRLVMSRVERIIPQHERFVLTLVFPYERYRHMYMERFPDIIFVLADCGMDKRLERINTRATHPTNDLWTLGRASAFESPKIAHYVLDNSSDGPQIREYISQLLGNIGSQP